MTLHRIPSEFPNMRGKFYFIFYQCRQPLAICGRQVSHGAAFPTLPLPLASYEIYKESAKPNPLTKHFNAWPPEQIFPCICCVTWTALICFKKQGYFSVSFVLNKMSLKSLGSALQATHLVSLVTILLESTVLKRLIYLFSSNQQVTSLSKTKTVCLAIIIYKFTWIFTLCGPLNAAFCLASCEYYK